MPRNTCIESITNSSSQHGKFSVLHANSKPLLRYRNEANIFYHIGVFPKCFTFVITVKGLEHGTSCLRVQNVTALPARHMLEQDLKIEPSSCFSDLSNSLSSMNSMKVLLHFGKSPLKHFRSNIPRVCSVAWGGKLVSAVIALWCLSSFHRNFLFPVVKWS